MATSADEFDCFQFFEVKHNPGCIITVTVLQARKVSKGWLGDLVDTPDPYVTICLDGAATPEVSTVAFQNNINPVWNETFEFYVEANKKHDIEFFLMDENYTANELLGKKTYHIESVNVESTRQKFQMEYGCELDVEIGAKIISETDLRYSLSLCREEKQYRKARKQRVFENMQRVFGEDAPKTVRDVPTIGVLGSGGGFRAMVGMGGAISALTDSQLWDLVTYTGVLSGSSWYLSQLYSNERWPRETPSVLQEELKANIRHSQLWLYTPSRVYKYLEAVLEKRQHGQPVSFTDLFGHLIGETLIKNRKEYRLSDMQTKIQDGDQPLPLFSCLHVKRNVSALTFHEWVEFSPHEIGMAKYGTFLPCKKFGSMFFMGKIIRQFEEPPLHYLLGLWGSAFTILLTRVFNKTKKDPIQAMRPNVPLDAIDTTGDGKEGDFADGVYESSSDDDLFEDAIEDEEEGEVSDVDNTCVTIPEEPEEEDEDEEFHEAQEQLSDDERSDTFVVDRPIQRNRRTRSAIKSHSPNKLRNGSLQTAGEAEASPNNNDTSLSNRNTSPSSENGRSPGISRGRRSSRRSPRKSWSQVGGESPEDTKQKKSIRRRSLRKSLREAIEQVSVSESSVGEISAEQIASFKRRSLRRIKELEALDKSKSAQPGDTKDKPNSDAIADANGEKLPPLENMSHGESFLNWALQTFLHSTGLLYKRFGRAAKIHNFMRGLCLSEVYPFSPLASTTVSPMPEQEDDETPFGEIFEKQSTEPKTLYLVDAGLTFNSPYPLLLRPQRGVDLYLSFDFSRRPNDNTPPFKELLLASKWAKLNRVPFPPIDPKIIEKEGWKECYVFKDDSDPNCPTVLHFPLVNVNFKNFKSPGVPRETKEEKDFGNFAIFDDPKDPYSTYNFSYEPYAFDRLSELVKFNTTLHTDLIKKEILDRVHKKKISKPAIADLSQILLLRSRLKKVRGNMAQKLFARS